MLDIIVKMIDGLWVELIIESDEIRHGEYLVLSGYLIILLHPSLVIRVHHVHVHVHTVGVILVVRIPSVLRG